MQNQTTGRGHTEGLLHFGCTSLPVIGTVFDCHRQSRGTGNTLRRWLPRAKASMPFLEIETSDTGMSVFAVLTGNNR